MSTMMMGDDGVRAGKTTIPLFLDGGSSQSSLF